MGAYVNPSDMSKEQWLAQNAVETNDPQISATHLPVCLVQMPRFSAAGIAYSAGELAAFKWEGDVREKRWFIAPIDKLLQVSNLRDYLK